MITLRTVQTVGVIGGGYVGHGVALQFAQFGYKVFVVNRSKEGTKKAVELLSKSLELSIQVGLFPDKKKQEILSLISFENSISHFSLIFFSLSISKEEPILIIILLDFLRYII